MVSLLDRINGQFGESTQDFSQYQNDPVGFAEEVLGETLTPDVKKMMESVRDHQVTYASKRQCYRENPCCRQGCVWWYKVFDVRQIYTAAAPPQSNLEKLLWGEICERL